MIAALDDDAAHLARELAGLVGYVCDVDTEEPIEVERIETRGVWFVCDSVHAGVYELTHAPTGASLAAYSGGERGMRKAIDLMRSLPETFGASAAWGRAGISTIGTFPNAAEIERLVHAARGDVLRQKLAAGAARPRRNRRRKR